jgi:flagellar protein FlbT
MPLRLKLKPQERAIIGGAAIQNGGARTEIFIENEVPVLREQDILSPASVRTPCERIYLALQLMYVDPARSADHGALFRSMLEDVAEAAPSCKPLLDTMAQCVREGRLYQGLKNAKTLLVYEQELLGHVQKRA